MVKALLFDVDGTLADTERDGHRVAFNKAFKDVGLDWSWSEPLYGDLLEVTGGKERIQHYIEKYLPAFKKPDNFKDFLQTLHTLKTRYYVELLEQGKVALRPGVERLIREARAKKLRLAITTTTTPENVDALLRNTLGPESISWFELIAAGDCVPLKKPAPDVYVYALEKMKLRADECIAFEDSENGIKSTSGAGIRTIVTVNDYTLEHDFTGALLVIDQLGEPTAPFTVLSSNRPIESRLVDIALIKQLVSE